MNFIDFFSGIGGIRLGMEQAGHKCVGFCEFDKFALKSYKAMYDTKGEFESHDVRTIKAIQLPKADLWCYGFPCQDLSIAGQRAGLEKGKRSGLFYEIIRLLRETKEENKPQWLLAENVKGLFSAGKGFDFARLLIELGKVGYDVQWQLLNSKDFGVPQNRERVFIIGCLRGQSGHKIFPITPTSGENTSQLKRLGNIYGDDKGTGYAGNVWDKQGLSPTLSTMQGGDRQPMIVACLTPGRETKRQNGRRFKKEGEPSFTLTSQDRHEVAFIDLCKDKAKITKNARCIQARYDKGVSNRSAECSGVLVSRNKLYRVTDIAATLLARDYKGFGNQPTTAVIQNCSIRKLTPRECWRLQGFPDSYFDKAKDAGVSNTQLYKQAGNAVTVNVAKAIGSKLH